ncbi:MAG TPA: caspase family protein [Thermoanaerobaculia bacterium]|jgi:hypothetical protein|nr:caspase family protein [Thermoanaerobaculia bacterium]
MQNRRALIIGIDKYPNLSKEAQLEGCVRDAREVAKLLETRFGFPPGQINLLLDEQATRDGILKALEKLAETVGENDAVVIHYSGHGSQREALTEDPGRASFQEETIVAQDSGHEDPYPNQDIYSYELRERIAKLTTVTPNVTVILDCCHSGTMAVMRDDKGRSVRIRSVKADVRGNPRRSNPRDFKGPASFIRHVVIAACRDKESAYEIPLEDGSHGALTWNLLRELESLPAGACPTYRDVFEPVRSRVHDRYKSQETQLEGVRERELFGLAELVPMSFLPVQHRRDDRVLLGGGATCGVAQKSVWTIHPPQSKQGGEVLGRVEVTEVRGMSATARVVDEVRPDAIGRWCRAVEETPAGKEGQEGQWRRYRNLLGTRNERSRLRGKVDFNLARKVNGKWVRLDEDAEIEEGEPISFAVINHHDKDLHVYVLDFGLTGNISQIYPVLGVSDPLEAGRSIEIGAITDELKPVVPEGVDSGEGFLKLIAATRAIDLLPLFQTVRGETRDFQVSLDPTRSSDDWITVELRYLLKRSPGGGPARPGRILRNGRPITRSGAPANS